MYIFVMTEGEAGLPESLEDETSHAHTRNATWKKQNVRFHFVAAIGFKKTFCPVNP